MYIRVRSSSEEFYSFDPFKRNAGRDSAVGIPLFDLLPEVLYTLLCNLYTLMFVLNLRQLDLDADYFKLVIQLWVNELDQQLIG